MAVSKAALRSPKTKPMFSIELTGWRDVMGRYARASLETNRLRSEGIEELRLWTEVMLKEEAPVFSGTLRDEITSDVEPTKGDTVLVHFVVDGVSANYVNYVTGGRGDVWGNPLLVYPTDPEGTEWVYSEHSGPAMPNDFVDRAVNRMETNNYGPEAIAQTVARRVQSVWNAYQSADY